VLEHVTDLVPLAQQWLGRVWNVVSQPIEAGILSGGGAGALTAFLVHRFFSRRAEVLPTLPSHVEALDGPQDQTTLFLAAVHDMAMSVTDAWNAARARQVHREPLEALINKDALLPACDAVKQQGAALRVHLADYESLIDQARRARDQLLASWTHRQKDHYRTETYTATTTDSKGKTRTQVRTRQVYDYSDHWFEFDHEIARRARDTVRAFLDFGADAVLPVPDLASVRVRLKALGEAERMFLRRMILHTVLEDAEAEIDDHRVEELLNQWLKGTRLSGWLQSVHGSMDVVHSGQGDAFRVILNSAPVSHYRVSSRSHAGPAGCQRSRALAKDLRVGITAWGWVASMLSTCEGAAFDLARWARDPGVIEDDVDYVRQAVAAYEGAFPDSELEIDQLPNHWVTWLVGVGVAAVVGGMVWYGLDARY
jgi:hypothetical protein